MSISKSFVRWLGCGLLICTAMASIGGTSAQAQDPSQTVALGTGGTSGVYYPVGSAICNIINRGRSDHGLSCSAESTGGSVDNIERIRSGDINFAIVQADILYYARNGFGPFKDSGPNTSLRSVVTLHTETFTVLARADAGIRSLDDLPGKRLNIGNAGSGQRTFFELLMRMKGWNANSFSDLQDHPADEQSAILCSGDVDAIVFVVGHPNNAIKSTAEACKTNLVDIRGPSVDALIAKYPYFVQTKIPGNKYPGAPTTVFSFGVPATLVTTSAMPEKTVNTFTRVLFNSFTDLKFSHAALSALTPQIMASETPAPTHPGTVQFIEHSTDLYKLMQVRPAQR